MAHWCPILQFVEAVLPAVAAAVVPFLAQVVAPLAAVAATVMTVNEIHRSTVTIVETMAK